MCEEGIYKHFKPAVKPQQEDCSEAYWFVFCQTKILLKEDNNQVSIPLARRAGDLGIKPVRKHYLGVLYGYPCYTVETKEETVAVPGASFQELFASYPYLPEDLFFLAGMASQILKWDQEHQYCGRCGAKTKAMDSERAKKCPVCGLTNYPELKPVVIVAVLNGRQILLNRSTHYRIKDMYSINAGFVEPGETLEECLRRELMEEVGISVKNIRYFGSRTWPFPNSLMVGFIADYAQGEITVDNEEIIEAGWFDLNNLPRVSSGVSISKKIIDWCVEHYSA